VEWKSLPVSSTELTQRAFDIEIQVDELYAALVDEENLRAAAVATLEDNAIDDAELTIVITSDEAVQQLNRDYRGVDAPTDVLSFAAQEGEEAETLSLPPELAAEMDRYLGDIIIAYPYTVQQAAHFGNSPAAELRLMVVHGVLHLLGDDHDTPEAEAEMWARQERVLAHFGDQGLSQRHYEPHE
jgi:probable rRNA maturation factor